MSQVETMKPNAGDGISDMIEDRSPELSQQTAVDSLPQFHKNYLLKRHGTLNLSPLPNMDPADPLNWPKWKVCIYWREKAERKRTGCRTVIQLA